MVDGMDTQTIVLFTWAAATANAMKVFRNEDND